ncbi:DNAAF3 [Lepeophtheirus salmonis]|uniref:DNAAF3 n=1 Tax=Lepeophtheirus salmonis TaxID=72036 RepID=A0A7R8H4Z3_LEPSM|nr:DNAAF3 [Lepeophtheirus salmonis]CAF2853248.1 DNAAF3 [Lepeophtheirus salmonis]
MAPGMEYMIWIMKCVFKETVLGITSKEYKKWRFNGIAFNCGYEEMDDQKIEWGIKVAIEGYWGDVVSGSPFIPFGINSEVKISLEDSKLKSMGSDSSISYLTKLLGNTTSRKVIFLPISFIEDDCDFLKHKLPKFNSIFIGNSKSHLLSKVKGYSDHLIVESLIGLISLSKGIHIGFQDKIKNSFFGLFISYQDLFIH